MPSQVVFISYSHDSEPHRETVLRLAERLRREGLEARLDRYVKGTPREGWPRWMLNQLDEAAFVLVVCTETYYRRFRGHEAPDRGQGADWEGMLITQEIYDSKSQLVKFVPVLLSPGQKPFIPEPLRAQTYYELTSDESYQDLYRFLVGQADVEPGPLGEIRQLPERTVEPLRFGRTSDPLPQEPILLARRAEELLALSNRAALSLYREHVLKQPAGDEASFSRSREILAGSYWGAAEYEVQRHYVQLRREENPEFIQQKACQLLGDGFASGTGGRIWIIGQAGTGKTTALYRIYFEILQALDRAEQEGRSAPYPMPMLLQPQRMNEHIISRLRATEDQRDFLATLLQIWMTRRQVTCSEEQMPRIFASFLDGLRHGTIVLLIDSYDELGRMDIQLDMFRHLFRASKLYICATRPEMYSDAPDHQVLHIRSTWDVSTIRAYLEQVFAGAGGNFAGELAAYIAEKDQVRWLRNPRYLHMLSTMLRQRLRAGMQSAAGLIALIEHGQYQLLKHIYDSALSRLHRIWSKRLGAAPALDEESFGREVRGRLQRVAQSQLESGTMMVPQRSVDEIWEALGKHASEIVARRTDLVTSDSHFYLASYNWIDFFLVDVVLHDLLSRSRSELTLPHLWTQTLITYTVEAAHGEPNKGGLDRLMAEIHEKLNHVRASCLEGRAAPARSYYGINLLHLLIRVQTFRNASEAGEQDVERQTHGSRFEREDFSRLYLDSVDLHRLAFVSCNFSGSQLTRANCERALFQECDFSYADLRKVNADHAVFEDCEFTLEPLGSGSDSEVSPVAGMSIQGAKLTSLGEDLFADFTRHGAIPQRSRYKSPFGKLFFERQREMLGEGLKRAEDRYLQEIGKALGPYQCEARCLVDLMAGGSNRRLIKLLGKYEKLRVLAIDRDGSEMNEIVNEVGERFAMVEREIDGAIDLAGLLAAHFDIRRADLVIGKKAIHEIPRSAQINLIRSTAEILPGDGRLILFVDAPYQIDDAGRERLAALQERLRSYSDRDLRPLREELLALSFGSSPSDLGVFSNLWVHLKDWANGNEHELGHRYFSGVPEITKWAGQAGLRQASIYSDYYHLVARRFNEAGFNQVCHRLEESKGIILDKDIGFFSEALEGGDRFRLFCEVVERHLWDAAYERPTALGVALNARRTRIDFHDLSEGLRTEKLSLSYHSGVGFDFPIHVLTFGHEGVR